MIIAEERAVQINDGAPTSTGATPEQHADELSPVGEVATVSSSPEFVSDGDNTPEDQNAAVSAPVEAPVSETSTQQE